MKRGGGNEKGDREMKKLLLIGLALFLLVGCAPTSPTLSPEIQELMERKLQETLEVEATYRVSGTAKSASLTYETPTGTEQRTVNLPWSKTYKFSKGDFAYISAQNQGEVGTVKVEIKVDGTVWKHAESSGAYVIASCSGALP